MNILIAGGTGFVGTALIQRLLKEHHQVTVLGRSLAKIKSRFPELTAITWDKLQTTDLKYFDLIINLAGENIGEKRWTSALKQKIIHSRVDSTEQLARCCAKLGSRAPRLLNASAIGIYGLHEHYPEQRQPVDETDSIDLEHPRDFLSEVGIAWEQALQPALDAGVPTTILRFGVVLDKKAGVLKKLLPSVKMGLAAVIGQGLQGFSWIHLEDLIAAILFIIAHPELAGPINCTSPHPVSQGEFIHQLAQVYKRPCFLKLPAFIFKTLLGEMAEELMIKGQKVYPSRLLAADFQFRYATLASALCEIAYRQNLYKSV